MADNAITRIAVKHRNSPVDMPNWAQWTGFLIVFCLIIAGVAIDVLKTPKLMIVPVLIVVLWFVARACLRWRSDREQISEEKQAGRDVAMDSPSSPGNNRLTCYGVDRELSALGDMRDYPFEPHLAQRSMDYAFPGGDVLPVLIIIVGGFAKMPLGTLVFAAAGTWVAFWTLARLRESYYRVVPGRLDILRAWFFGAKVTCVKSLSLKEATIVCRFDEQELAITPRGKEYDYSEFINLRRLAAPHAFVRAVFQGATSTHLPPPLPDDDLLG